MLISVAHVAMSWRNLFASLLSRNALIGIASGTCFGIAAVAYRAASLSLGRPELHDAGCRHAGLRHRVPDRADGGLDGLARSHELGRIAPRLEAVAFTGLVGATASFGWFMAMTLQQAAIVKALGQIELLFTFASAVFFFHEKINRWRRSAAC